jgi:ribosomal protein L32
MMRHYVEYKKGHRVCQESGQLHLAHMLCNIAYMIAIVERRKDVEYGT